MSLYSRCPTSFKSDRSALVCVTDVNSIKEYSKA